MRDATTPSPPRPVREVAIVGGGAAGVLVALHLLRAGEGRLRPRLIEPREHPGEGIAYSTRHPVHVLNVRAGNMSAFADAPGDFVEYAGTRDATPDAGTPLGQRYLPRAWYAAYLRDALVRRADGLDLHVRDRVVDIEGDGPFRLRLQSGARLDADAVVLATGNAPRAALAPGTGQVPAWDYDAIAAIDPTADVAIVGSGLSMVDVAMSLGANGHHGRIDVFSRHGLLPLAHHALGGPHDPVEGLEDLGVRARLRRLRAEGAALAADGRPWQWLMDRLRPQGRALWRSLPPVEQARFLRHAVRHWDIHRHRIAPEAAERLQGLLRNGQLRVHAARVRDIEAGDSGVRLRVRPRGADSDQWQQADCLVDATGIETRLQALPGSLLATLAGRGRVAPGPHGLGIAVDPEGRVLVPGGAAAPGLYAIGTPRLGEEWETTAVPDLRVQAAAIAARLAAVG